MKTHPYGQSVQNIPTLGFIGEQVIKHLNELPGKMLPLKMDGHNQHWSVGMKIWMIYFK